MAVYCGSSSGTDEIYAQQAYLLGTVMAQRKIGLVFGGGKVGLMNSVANGVLAYGGEAVGVLPKFLDRVELAHEELTEMVVVSTMHERKYRMYELSDGIIALPGGYGTLDELFEMLTWEQLGLHKKPIGILNTNGFYDSLLEFLRSMAGKGFLKEEYREMLLVSNNVPGLLELMENFRPPSVGKWI
jgi:uncharacterized protein (TIGR00730 family)